MLAYIRTLCNYLEVGGPVSRMKSSQSISMSPDWSRLPPGVPLVPWSPSRRPAVSGTSTGPPSGPASCHNCRPSSDLGYKFSEEICHVCLQPLPLLGVESVEPDLAQYHDVNSHLETMNMFQ